MADVWRSDEDDELYAISIASEPDVDDLNEQYAGARSVRSERSDDDDDAGSILTTTSIGDGASLLRVQSFAFNLSNDAHTTSKSSSREAQASKAIEAAQGSALTPLNRSRAPSLAPSSIWLHYNPERTPLLDAGPAPPDYAQATAWRSLLPTHRARAEGADNKIRQSIITTLMRYLGTDTLLCWAPVKNAYGGERQEGTKPLRERQKEIAEPIIAHLTAHVFPGLEIVPILGEDSIVPISQPEITQQVIQGWLAGLPPIDLAALERGTLATKSLLIGARLLVEWSEEFARSRDVTSTETGRFDIDKATEAASLEVLHQTEEWGEVDDTHDVDREDMRRQLGSVILLVT